MTVDLAELSREAQAFLASLPPFEERPKPPALGDVEAWATWQAHIETVACERSETVAEAYREAVKPVLWHRAGELEAVTVSSYDADPDMPPIIFLHGGAYVGFSARSSLFAVVPLAAKLRTSVTSICYPLAPQQEYRTIVAQTAASVAAMLGENTLLLGDSAGGGLAVAVTLYLKENGLRLPNKLALWSPWVDLQANAPIDDPILRYENDLEICAAAYAGGEVINPLASPLYADFSAGFPSLLTQMGSREIFCPSVEGFHQKLTAVGVRNKLQIYEGMYHSFPVLTPDAPESVDAVGHLRAYMLDDTL